jgi:hypothetical protein
MGLSIFGGRLAVPPVSLSELCVGARGYARLPHDALPKDLFGRPVVVLAIDEARGAAGQIQASEKSGIDCEGNCRNLGCWINIFSYRCPLLGVSGPLISTNSAAPFLHPPFLFVNGSAEIVNKCMYNVEFCFSPSAIFIIYPHFRAQWSGQWGYFVLLMSKGSGQGLYCVVHFRGYGLGFILCCTCLRVGARG